MDVGGMKKMLAALERGKAPGTDPSPPAQFLKPGSADLLREIEQAWSHAPGAGLSFPPGVYRHRSVEDMNRQTEAWNDANAARLRALLSAEMAPAARKRPSTPDPG